MTVSLLVLPMLAAAVPAPADIAAFDVPQADLAIVAYSDTIESSGEGSEVAAAASPPVAQNDDASGQREIVVNARPASPADPVEQFNAISYEAVQAVDEAVVGRVAHAYKASVPKPVRDGVHNVLDNLDEPIVFLNFLLQLKPGKAIETLGRFAINSTIGVAGLFDVARKKPFNLPRRSNGLADTLGYYGVGPGPYLFLPLIGSTTVRDLAARPFDLLLLPALAPRPFADSKVALGKASMNALDERDQNDEKLKRLHAASDPYVAQREDYLARRRAEIEVLKGKRKSIWDPPYYELPESDNVTSAPDAAAGKSAVSADPVPESANDVSDRKN